MPQKHLVALCSALLVLGAAACEGEDTPDADVAPAPATVPTPSVPAGSSVAPAVGVGLAVGESPEHGSYLTDASGRALYLLEGDSAGTSSCYDACAEAWPPFLAPSDTPAAGAAPVQASLIGTLERRDGTFQVTYNGHPLHYYARDGGAGQTTGQDVTDQWGEWYLVTPQGEVVGH